MKWKHRKIRINNERLWQIAQDGEDIDQWLKDNVGMGNYREWFSRVMVPYRLWSFKNEEHATMFMLRWS